MALQGNLNDLPLANLLQILALQKKEGVLYITSRAHSAEIMVDDGMLWAAFVYETIDGKPEVQVQGEEAVYTMMDWSQGQFSFHLESLPQVKRNIFSGPEYLLLEQSRRRDERDRQQLINELGRQVPHLVVDTPAVTQIHLSPEEWQVLVQVNGLLNVSEIAAVLKHPLEQVMANMEELKTKKLVNLVMPAAKPTQKLPFPNPGLNMG
jgi:hypothetical protein